LIIFHNFPVRGLLSDIIIIINNFGHYRFLNSSLLCEGGFDGGPIEMDDLWIGLVERAVRKKFRESPNLNKGSLLPP